MKKILALAILVVLCAFLTISMPAFAADNETSIVATNTYVFDMGPIIELALVFGGIATLGFVISELYGTYTTKSAQMGILQSTTTGINSVVAMTTLAVAAAQGIAVTEISGVPTQITQPEKSAAPNTQSTSTAH
jgi:hypothetical protein